MTNIDIKGVEPLMAKLERVRGLTWLKAVLINAMLDIKNQIAIYPPINNNDKMVPGGRWYQRGYGPKWMLRSGEVHGYKTSENLGQQWTTYTDSDGFGGRVGNKVTRAKWVQGPEQARWHAARGWQTTEKVATEHGPKVVEKIRLMINQILGGA